MVPRIGKIRRPLSCLQIHCFAYGGPVHIELNWLLVFAIFRILAMERMVKILEMYRDNEDPNLRVLNGRSLETLSRDENLTELENRGIEGLRLCRLGSIDPRPEFLCRLLHYAIGIDEAEAESSTSGGPSVAEPAKKKQKKAAAVTVC